jgi:hypothetical protein
LEKYVAKDLNLSVAGEIPQAVRKIKLRELRVWEQISPMCGLQEALWRLSGQAIQSRQGPVSVELAELGTGASKQERPARTALATLLARVTPFSVWPPAVRQTNDILSITKGD